MENKDKERHWKPYTLSISDSILTQIDFMRGDVSRSKYISRILESFLKADAVAVANSD